MTVKDWITTSMAIVAFVLSFATAYVNSWPTNELAAIVSKTPAVNFTETDIEFAGPVELMFVNGGNRPMGIVSIELMAVQPQPDVDFKDCNGIGAYGYADFKPFVVKGSEVVVQSLKFTQGDPLKIVDSNKAKQPRSVMICLSFSVATPGRLYPNLRKPLFQVSHSTGEQGWQYDYFYKSTQPISLIKRQSTILGENNAAAN